MIKQYIIGMCMGACDMVPGVSGGTIALVMGVYEKLLNSITSVLHPSTWKILLTGDIVAFWKHIGGTFLVTLFAGIGTSILIFSHVFETLLETSPEFVWAFFLGLVLATIFFLWKKEGPFTGKKLFGVCIGALIAYGITRLGGGVFTPSRWYIILCAAIAISAMILPGISGSFLLLLFGMYEPLLQAITSLDIHFLSLFMIGAIIGLGLFSRIIAYLLHHFRGGTIATLVGCMIGSLPILWPWKITNDYGNEIATMRYSIEPGILPRGVFLVFLVGSMGGYKVFNIFDQLN